MAVEYIVLDQGTFVYAHAYGVLTEADFLEHEHTLNTDMSVRGKYRHLLDVRYVTEPNLDARPLLKGLRDLQQEAPKLNGSRCAVVAHDAWWFDVSFQRQCGTHGLTLIAFNDPATACLWLGVNYTQLLCQAARCSCLMAVGAQPGD
jgi:hypothetical protein